MCMGSRFCAIYISHVLCEVCGARPVINFLINYPSVSTARPKRSPHTKSPNNVVTKKLHDMFDVTAQVCGRAF
jgi:hypothetical protein